MVFHLTKYALRHAPLTSEESKHIQLERAILRHRWNDGSIDTDTYTQLHDELILRNGLYYGYRSGMSIARRCAGTVYGLLGGGEVTVSMVTHNQADRRLYTWPDTVYVGICTHWISGARLTKVVVEEPRKDTPEQRRATGWRTGDESRAPLAYDGSWDDVGVDLTNEELRAWRGE